MMASCREVHDYEVGALRTRIGKWLTNSDCRVALREADGDLDHAVEWLLHCRILERARYEVGRRLPGCHRKTPASILIETQWGTV